MNAQKIISVKAIVEIRKNTPIPVIIKNTAAGAMKLEVSKYKVFKNRKDSCLLIIGKYSNPTEALAQGRLLQATYASKVIYGDNPVAPNVYQFYQELKPKTITYNGSDDPNECIESVDFGLNICTHKGDQFFHIPFGIYKKINQTDKTTLYRIQVDFENQETHENDSGSNGAGTVIRIEGLEDDSVLYDQYKYEE